MKFFPSFPHIRQTNAKDCGPTALRIIARHYGVDYPADVVRRYCHISKDGVSMQGISDAAERLGFDTCGVKLTFDQLVAQGVFPCILHWNQNHFVVCYAIKTKENDECRIHVSDPASFRLTYTREEFERCWIGGNTCEERMGLALMLEPGEMFGKTPEVVHGAGCRILSFLRYITPHRRMLAQLLLAMFAGSIIQMVLPFLSQAMIDQGVNGQDLSVITLILVAQLGFFVATMSIEYVRSWVMLYMNARIDISLISDFLVKLTAMPLSFFDSRMTGDILQRLSDHARIKNFLLGNSLRIVFSLVNFVVFIAILTYYNVLVMVIFVVGNVLHIVWVSFFMRYRRELDIKRFAQSALEQSRMIQLIHGMQDIKLNNSERQKRWEWERIQVKLFGIGQRSLHIGQVQQTGVVFFTQTTGLVIYYLAARAVVDGSMTLGMMMSLSYIIGQVSAPIGEFIGLAQSFQDARISMERLEEINAQDDEERNIESKISQLPECLDIRLTNVFFSYSGAEYEYALQDVNLYIPAQKVTALVGASGCGKTTLIKLLQGFYEPTSGSIEVGGVCLHDVNPHVWRAATGSVMQDSFIFSDTIAGNIAINAEGRDMQRVRQAARIAQIDSFADNLPSGYDTMIGMEGKGISQGQRQRILIARAIYKNPKYIFLDEATNALDAKNEAEIMSNLRQFYQGRTVVISAHRLSTVRDADHIVVLDNGTIVEQGSHMDLLQKEGRYYELVKHQMDKSQCI